MDGYAVKLSDYESSQNDNKLEFMVVDEVLAGHLKYGEKKEQDGNLPNPILPPTFDAVYVTTGAVIPKGYTCVIPMENSLVTPQTNNKKLTFTKYTMPKNNNIRLPGCDIKAGTVILEKGQVITPPIIGLLATIGEYHVEVNGKVSVGVISSGDELIDISSHHHVNDKKILGNGKIIDANRPMLLSLLSSPTTSCIDYGIIKDDKKTTSNIIQKAISDNVDVIITSGGVSMGTADHMKQILVDFNATIHFGRLAMKPGKPTTFATIVNPINGKEILVFCLPGNPVSCVVCSQLLVLPCLKVLSSKVHYENDDSGTSSGSFHPKINVLLKDDITLDKDRAEYHRCVISYDANTSTFSADSTGVQRSSRLLSMIGTTEKGENVTANGLLVLPRGGVIKKGEMVEALLIGGLMEPSSITGVVEAKAKIIEREVTKRVIPSYAGMTINVLFVSKSSNSIDISKINSKLELVTRVFANGCVTNLGFVNTNEIPETIQRLENTSNLLLVYYLDFPFCDSEVCDILAKYFEKPSAALAEEISSIGSSHDQLYSMRPVVVGSRSSTIVCGLTFDDGGGDGNGREEVLSFIGSFAFRGLKQLSL